MKYTDSVALDRLLRWTVNDVNNVHQSMCLFVIGRHSRDRVSLALIEGVHHTVG